MSKYEIRNTIDLQDIEKKFLNIDWRVREKMRREIYEKQRPNGEMFMLYGIRKSFYE